MSALHLAGPGDLDRLAAMVAAAQAETGTAQDSAQLRAALAPLLEGSPHGAIWLIGPRSAPVGHVAVSFGWSIALGGLEATITEFQIREKVRSRGMGGEALIALTRALRDQGIAALHLAITPDNARAQALFRRLGFAHNDRYRLLSQML